ncbi:MAG: ABC-F type ribosomal protection protein [Candidatus Absconditabacterales bacterium]|nr:ABC-F type ribosomal protection protein [Candidatus Absconditabacterales bacterium]
MLRLGFNNITFKYENSVENILENISAELHDNMKVGLIGDNGCGKSTLLKILTSIIKPDSGEVITKGNSGFYVSQEISEFDSLSIEDFIWNFNQNIFKARYTIYNSDDNKKITEALDFFEQNAGYEYEEKFSKLVSIFNIKEIGLNKQLRLLSGGEKTKISLVRILMQNPGYLMLDEPTNHLDEINIKWLEEYLLSIEIPFIVVSHDRKFLDNTVNTIWEIADKKLNIFSGNYSMAREEKEARLQFDKKQYKKITKKITDLKKDVVKKREWAGKFQKQTGTEGNAPAYEDITNDGKRAMKRAIITQKRTERLIEKAEETKPFIKKERTIFFDYELPPKDNYLEVEDLIKYYDDKKILKGLKFSLKRGDKIHIKGENGSGKTTLLKILTGEINDYYGNVKWSNNLKIGYFSQNCDDIDGEQTIIEKICESRTKDEQTEARTILGCVGIEKDKVFSKLNKLSPGEKSKVKLTMLLLQKPNILILDEPTNHLEISIIEKLENALIVFEGGIIFVSHDRYFAEKIATMAIEL